MNKDVINQIGTIIIWIAGIILWVLKDWWYITAFVFALHFVEMLVIGIKTGREHGRSAGFSALMTLIFGFTWWKPLRDSQ